MERKAFTLIELLVVITVITILIGIVIPALSNSRESSKATKCGSQQRSIVQMAHDYYKDTKDKWPGSWESIFRLPPGEHFVPTSYCFCPSFSSKNPSLTGWYRWIPGASDSEGPYSDNVERRWGIGWMDHYSWDRLDTIIDIEPYHTKLQMITTISSKARRGVHLDPTIPFGEQ